MLPLLLLMSILILHTAGEGMQKEEATAVDRTEAEVCAAVMKARRGKGRVAVPGVMIMRGETLVLRIGMAG